MCVVCVRVCSDVVCECVSACGVCCESVCVC